MVLSKHCSQTLKPQSFHHLVIDRNVARTTCPVPSVWTLHFCRRPRHFFWARIFIQSENLSQQVYGSLMFQNLTIQFFIDFFLNTVNNKHLIFFSIFNKICYIQLVKPRIFRSLVLDWIFHFWIEKQRCCLFNLLSGLSQFPVWRNVFTNFSISVFYIPEKETTQTDDFFQSVLTCSAIFDLYLYAF